MDAEVSETRKRFTPPTPQEVYTRAREIGLPATEAEKFWLFYHSKGWKVGKSPMVQWRSSLAGWRIRWMEANPRAARAMPSRPPRLDDLGPEPMLGL